MPQILVHLDRTYAIDVLDLSKAYLFSSSLPPMESVPSLSYTTTTDDNPPMNNCTNAVWVFPPTVPGPDNDKHQHHHYHHHSNGTDTFSTAWDAYLYDITAPIPPHTSALTYRLCQLLYMQHSLRLPVTYQSDDYYRRSYDSSLTSLPFTFTFTLPNGQLLPPFSSIPPSFFVSSSSSSSLPYVSANSPLFLRARCTRTLSGGKGGFGANLKAMGKQQLAKQTTDFSACRDLSGRRLRDINNEIRLKKWLSSSETERRKREGEFYEEAKGENGIQGWFLNVPSWVDRPHGSSSVASEQQSYHQKQSRLRKKTILCRNWLNAHQTTTSRLSSSTGSNPPHHGCPRGNHCEYAHGYDEVNKYRSILTEENTHLLVPKEEIQFKKQNEAQKQLDGYVKNMYVYDDTNEEGDTGEHSNRMLRSVQQGLGSGSSSTGLKRALDKADSGNSDNDDDGNGEDNHDSDDDKEDDEEDIDWGQQFHQPKQRKRPHVAVNNRTSLENTVNPFSSSSSSSSTVSSYPTMMIPFVPPSVYRPKEWIYTPTATAVDIDYLDNDGLSLVRITGNQQFSTIAIGSCRVPSLSSVPCINLPIMYVYEVEILTSNGIIQIGWADPHYFQPNRYLNEGVGDDTYSYSYDGLRGLKWHPSGGSNDGEEGEGSSIYGKQYQVGDIVTCYIIIENALKPMNHRNSNSRITDTTLSSSSSSSASSSSSSSLSFIPTYQASIGYRINGEDMGIAFIVPLRGSGGSSEHPTVSSSSSLSSSSSVTLVRLPFQSLIPAISLDEDESICINIGKESIMYNSPLSYIAPSDEREREGAEARTIEGIPLYRIRNTGGSTKNAKEEEIVTTNDDTTVSPSPGTANVSAHPPTIVDKPITTTATVHTPTPVLTPLITAYLEQLYRTQCLPTDASSSSSSSSSSVLSASRSSIYHESIFRHQPSLDLSLDELKHVLNDYGLKSSGTLNERWERLVIVLKNLSTVELRSPVKEGETGTTETLVITQVMENIIPKKLRNTSTYPTVTMRTILERLLYGKRE